MPAPRVANHRSWVLTIRPVRTPRAAPAPGDDRVSAGSGQPPTRTTSPSVETRRAARPVDPSQPSAASPRTIAAVAAVLASTHVAATTDAVRHGDSTGRAGPRIDEVVQGAVAAPPAPDGRARRRDRAGPDRDDLAGSVRPAPRCPPRRGSASRRRAACPRRRCRRRARRGRRRGPSRRCARLGGEVGGERLARRTQVDLDAARDPDARGGPRRARPSASRARPRSGPRAAHRPGAGSGSRGRSRSARIARPTVGSTAPFVTRAARSPAAIASPRSG